MDLLYYLTFNDQQSHPTCMIDFNRSHSKNTAWRSCMCTKVMCKEKQMANVNWCCAYTNVHANISILWILLNDLIVLPSMHAPFFARARACVLYTKTRRKAKQIHDEFVTFCFGLFWRDKKRQSKIINRLYIQCYVSLSLSPSSFYLICGEANINWFVFCVCILF